MATFKSSRQPEKSLSIGSCGIFLLLVANLQFVVTSVTWTAPPPAWTQTIPRDIRTVNMSVTNGSTQAPLKWAYTIIDGSTLIATTFSIGDGSTSDDIGSVFHTQQDKVTVFDRNDYPTRFAISTSEVATLIINSITEREEAVYQCELQTTSGKWKYRIRVIVTVPVKLTNVSNDQTVREGSNITLVCEATARPRPGITWIKVLEGGSNSEVLHHGPTWNFPNISRSDSGTYRCTADSGYGNPVNHKVKVNVAYPAKIVKLPSVYEVSAQGILSLHCEAKGNPQPTYTWTPCDPQPSVCDKSTLKFTETRNNSVYMYTCKVENVLGIDKRNTSVFIASNVINVTLVITSESCTDQGLWKKLSEKVNEVFADVAGYESAQLKEIRCGSVIVDLALKFNSTVREIEVISILRHAVKIGKLGDFNVSAITGTRHDTETATAATTPTGPSASKTWIIVVAVLVPLFVLFVVAGIVAWCVYNKRKCKKKDTKVHNESQVQATDDVQGEYATVNQGYVPVDSNRDSRAVNQSSVPPLTYDTVENRTKGKKEVVQEKPPVSYAVVDKTRKKKREKKPQPGELQYAELGEFPRAEGMPRTSASRGSYPTETQYADVSGM